MIKYSLGSEEAGFFGDDESHLEECAYEVFNYINKAVN
jgi:hypothetical protein